MVVLSHKSVILCGGTLIDELHVLATAVCVKNITKDTDLEVTGGAVDLEKFEPAPQNRFAKKIYRVNDTIQYGKVKKTEGGEVNYPIDDIVLIRLSDKLDISNAVKAIDVAKDNATEQTRCQVSGWGATSAASQSPSKTLFYTDVIIKDVDKCVEGLLFEPNANITNASYVCIQSVGKQPLCKGDEGSGIICNGKLQGIVSWGMDCDYPYSIGVNIVPYSQWIKDTIKQSNSDFGTTTTTTTTTTTEKTTTSSKKPDGNKPNGASTHTAPVIALLGLLSAWRLL